MHWAFSNVNIVKTVMTVRQGLGLGTSLLPSLVCSGLQLALA